MPKTTKKTKTVTPSSDAHWQIGSAYFIRTVTHHHVGRLVAVTDKELVLEEAAWVADDGRFSECLARGTVNEAEPFPDGPVIIGRASLIDAALWKHPLIRTPK